MRYEHMTTEVIILTRGHLLDEQGRQARLVGRAERERVLAALERLGHVGLVRVLRMVTETTARVVDERYLGGRDD